VLLFSVPVQGHPLEEITARLTGLSASLLLFALTAEQPGGAR